MIFTQLILAHLLGDFILQPNSWVSDKEQKKGRSPYLYLHIVLHFALSMLFLWDLRLWWVAVIVAVSHFIIDWAKLQFQKPNTKRKWFIWDQLLHIIVIAILSMYLSIYSITDILRDASLMKIITGAIFLTLPCSIIIKNLITYWTPFSKEKDAMETDSLANAGKYIGILERLLVFIFIIVNHWEGVGFMIAAKSVFRFSDLAQAKQRKLTEYVLIGTLLSFGIAVLTGIVVKF